MLEINIYAVTSLTNAARASTRANFSSVHIMYILKQDVLNFSWSEYRAKA